MIQPCASKLRLTTDFIDFRMHAESEKNAGKSRFLHFFFKTSVVNWKR